MKQAPERFAELVAFGQRKYGAKFRTKRNGKSFWHLLNRIRNILFFNPTNDFVNNVITTVGPYIFFPAAFSPEDATDAHVSTYAHELEHVRQYKKCGLGNAWLGTPVFLVLYALVPLPIFFAWFRYYFERSAFRAEAEYATPRGLPRSKNTRIVRALTGKMYFFAWYSKKSVFRWLEANLPRDP